MPEPVTGRIALGLKVPYTAFVLVLVPFYTVGHGVQNFLWFSDVALLALVVALWRESRLLFSMIATATLLPELAWVVDFILSGLLGGSVLGIAGYMYDAEEPLHLRVLSGFHLFLPPVMLWGLWRLGYDRRAFALQLPATWAILLATWLLTDPADNINWVFGPGTAPQEFVPAPLYLVLVMAVVPLCLQLPVHLVLRRVFARS